MSNLQAARDAYTNALDAMRQWSRNNEQRMDMGEKVVMLAQTGQHTEREEAAASYQQLCEMEMLLGGAAIVAISKAHEMLMQAYDELAPEPLLSAPSDTTTG
jgi:hypothetical protein